MQESLQLLLFGIIVILTLYKKSTCSKNSEEKQLATLPVCKFSESSRGVKLQYIDTSPPTRNLFTASHLYVT